MATQCLDTKGKQKVHFGAAVRLNPVILMQSVTVTFTVLLNTIGSICQLITWLEYVKHYTVDYSITVVSKLRQGHTVTDLKDTLYYRENRRLKTDDRPVS